jgi:hypothetical protein
MASITFAPPKAQQQACVPYPPEVKHLNKDTVIITIGDKTFYATGHGICICTNEEELNKITQFRGAPKRKAGSDDEEDEQLDKQQKAKKRALAAVERCKEALNDKDKEQLQKVLEATPTGPTAQVNSAAASQEDIAGAPLKQPYSPKSGLLVAIEMDEAAARAKDEVVKTLETVFTDSDSDSDSKTEA